jgi:hypothetical protein
VRGRTRIGAGVIVGLFLCVVAGCGFGEATQEAEAAVGAFHNQLNGSRFGEMYSGATPAFRSAGPQADFVAYLEAVHRKLGAFKKGERGLWRVNTTTNGTFVDLNYESEFEQDTATEEFTFLMLDSGPVLQRYNISSRTLVTK